MTAIVAKAQLLSAQLISILTSPPWNGLAVMLIAIILIFLKLTKDDK
jgi:hypothetical protein